MKAPTIWLIVIVIALVAILARPYDQFWDDDDGDDGSTMTATDTQTPTETTSVTASDTTTSSTTTPSGTTTTTTTGAPTAEPAELVVWPFATADAQDGGTFRILGVWPNFDDPDEEIMDWSGAPLGFWSGSLSGNELRLGGMTVSASSYDGPRFGGPDYWGAQARVYVFDANGSLLATTAPAGAYEHLPFHHEDQDQWTFDHAMYYFGDQNQAPAGTQPLPFQLQLFKQQLRTLLEGAAPGQATSVFIPADSYCDNFFNICYGDLWITGRLDDVAFAQ